MGNLVLNGQTVLTQTGTETPTLNTNVLNKGLSPLDTSASQGPTTDLTSTSLPIFGCRAFVNFNGSTDEQTVGNEVHCQIRSSGNISKVVKNTTGKYQIYFSSPMPDGNYCVTYGAQNAGANANASYTYIHSLTTTSFQVWMVHSGAYQNAPIICFTIFR